MALDPFDSRELEYVIGLILAVLWPVFPGLWASTGARSFYPTVLIVIASYSALPPPWEGPVRLFW